VGRVRSLVQVWREHSRQVCRLWPNPALTARCTGQRKLHRLYFLAPALPTPQLVLQTPAPVIASMLSYHNTHTAWLVAQAGGTWSRYTPGDDHKR
jgi:hypothetical protein